jgi:hypothetical protein
MSAGTMYEVAMRFAAPMWGLVEDHAVAAVKIDDSELERLIEAATEEESVLNSEWVRKDGAPGGVVLRVDLGLADGTGIDFTLPPEAEDVETLAGYDRIEIWTTDECETFKIRPRSVEVLRASEAMPARSAG